MYKIVLSKVDEKIVNEQINRQLVRTEGCNADFFSWRTVDSKMHDVRKIPFFHRDMYIKVNASLQVEAVKDIQVLFYKRIQKHSTISQIRPVGTL